MAITENLRKCRKQVGMMFKLAREGQGWSVEQVATMAGLKPATIEKIEIGAFNYPLDIISRVADVLGCQVIIKEKE